MEIERKWLTFGWPEGLKAAAVIRMEQGYIATRPTVRIRLEERGIEDAEHALRGLGGV